MKKYFLAVALFFVFAISASGQQTKPAPSPTPPDDNDVVKISTNLIQVDVTVTDSKGKVITDLKQDEMEIYENGKRQNISNFSFVVGTRIPTKLLDQTKSSHPEAYLPAPTARPEQVRRTIAIVVDDLSLSFGSTVWVVEALKKFVNEQMQDGDLVAIIRTGAGIGALQQFTMDKRQLLAAIKRVKFNMAGASRVSIFNPMTSSLKESIGSSADVDPKADATSRQMDQKAGEKENDTDNFRSEIFVKGTLGALNFVVRGMKDLPGRKSVLLLSDGFSLVHRDIKEVPHETGVRGPLQRLVDLANRSSVVFYGIDARGLVYSGPTAEDEMSSAAKIRARESSIVDSQEGIRLLSDQTGGIAIINSNDINKGIRRVLDDQSYYLVAYLPNDETFDAKTSRYNNLDVKVSRPGVRVRFRSGFFSIASENIVKPQLSVVDSIVSALTSPFAVNDVTVRINSIFVGDPWKGLSVRTFVNVDPEDITFTKLPDGKYRSVIDVIAFVYGDNGTVVDQRSNGAVVLATPAEYEQILKRGLVSDFVIPIKKPGGYQFRLAVRDRETNRVGSANQFIDVTDLSKKRLSVSGAVLLDQPVNRTKYAAGYSDSGSPTISDAIIDTSIRQFKAGSVLRYDYYVYNAKLDAWRKANLSYKLRLYRDGKLVFEAPPMALPILKYESPMTISTSGLIQIGQEMVPGDYILRAEITDLNAGKKNNSVDQFVQFEIVE